MSVSSILMNGQMARYGDMAVAGVGVAMKVTMMTGMLCIGLGQGVQPLLGYCVGAKNWTRYRQALRFSLALALGLSAVLTGLCYVFVRPIVRAFLTDPAAFDYGVSFARILLSTSILFGVFYVLVNALQACGAATESLIVNISRQGLVYIPAMFLLGAGLSRAGTHLGPARGRRAVPAPGGGAVHAKEQENDGLTNFDSHVIMQSNFMLDTYLDTATLFT